MLDTNQSHQCMSVLLRKSKANFKGCVASINVEEEKEDA
jgi:hypothetical protein